MGFYQVPFPADFDFGENVYAGYATRDNSHSNTMYLSKNGGKVLMMPIEMTDCFA